MFWRFCSFALVLCLLANPVAAKTDIVAQEKAIWKRMATAGLQRMLTQRIEQAACFLMAGENPDHYATLAIEAANTFENNLRVLTHGDETLVMAAETDEDVLAALAQTRDMWRTFGAAARQIMAGDLHAVPVRQLITLDRPLLDLTEETSKVLKNAYQEHMLARQRLLSTINIAARQRMLAVRLAKSFCYVALDLNRSMMLEEMAETAAQFDAALTALERGDFDMEVVDPPNLAVMSALMDVRTAWTEFQEMLEQTMNNPDVAAVHLEKVASDCDALRALSHQVVLLYLDL